MKIAKIKRIIKDLPKSDLDQNWLEQSQQSMAEFMADNPVRKPTVGRQTIMEGIFKKLILKPMPIVIIALIISLATGGGVVAAAQGSLPTDALYPVKIATEQIQESVTFDNAKKIELSIKLAEKRLNEIKQLQDKGEVSPTIVEETLVKYEKHLTNAQSQLANFSRDYTAPKLITAAVKYEDSLENQQKELTALTNQISVESQPSLDKAQKAIIANSNQILDKIGIKIQQTETSETQARTGTIGDKTEVLPPVLMEKVPEYIPNIDEKTKNRIKTAENKLAEIRKKIDNFAGQEENKCELAKKQAFLEKLETHYQKMTAALTEAQKLFDQKNYLAALNQTNYVMVLAIDTDNLVGQWHRNCNNPDNESIACKAPSCIGAYQTGEYESDNCPVYKCPNNETIRVVTLNQKIGLKIGETVGVENENIQITLNKIQNACPSCPVGASCSPCLAPTAQLEISYYPNEKIIQSINLGLNQSKEISPSVYLKLLNLNEEDYVTLILNKGPYGCDAVLNCAKGTIQRCSGKYDGSGCPICTCEPIACPMLMCGYPGGAYKTGEFYDNGCPIYKCLPSTCNTLLNCPSGTTQLCSGKYDGSGCPICNCEPVACQAPNCIGAYKTSEYDNSNCPIYKCPGKECKAVFSNCSCAYNCMEVIEGQGLNDCMRACSVNEINNYKPNCGYQNGVCRDLNQTDKPCPVAAINCLAGFAPSQNGNNENGCPIWICKPVSGVNNIEIDESSNSTQSSQSETSIFEPILKFLQLK